MPENNITALIEELNMTNLLIRTNNEVEDNIIKNGGKVLYSYNNMIIASEISDTYYTELAKNPNVENLYTVPLKRYGNIDSNLINQIDATKINQKGNTNNNYD